MVVIVKPERTGFVEVTTEEREEEEGLIPVGTESVFDNEVEAENEIEGGDPPPVLVD